MYIGNKNTNNWGKLTDYEIGAPEVQTRFIEVPARNGLIDATESLLGYPTYFNRTIKLEITVVKNRLTDFRTIYDEVMNYCHGKVRELRFNLENGYFYRGRCNVSIKQESQLEGVIEIECNAEPYAYKNTLTTKNIAVGDVSVSSDMPTDLTIKATSLTKLEYEGEQMEFSIGEHKITYPKLYGNKVITITQGSGTIEYQEGKL